MTGVHGRFSLTEQEVRFATVLRILLQILLCTRMHSSYPQPMIVLHLFLTRLLCSLAASLELYLRTGNTFVTIGDAKL